MKIFQYSVFGTSSLAENPSLIEFPFVKLNDLLVIDRTN